MTRGRHPAALGPRTHRDGRNARVNQVAEAADIVAQEAKTFERTTAAHTPDERAAAHEALLTLTAASGRLAQALDVLASEYAVPGRAEPSTAHIALDQAAAAAEDLSACTRLAARAIDSDR